MPEFAQGSNAVIAGAGGGIGRALLTGLLERNTFSRIYALTRDPARLEQDVRDARVTCLRLDYDQPDTIRTCEERIAADRIPLQLVIIATGILHAAGIRPEKRLQDIDPERLQRVFYLNTTGPMMLAAALAPQLDRESPAVLAALSARVGSIGDNRLGGWYAYRASKAALNMLFRTMSVELARVNPQAIVSLLHPGTVATGLSQPFQAGVAPEKLFTPKQSAGYLLAVIAGLQADDNGSFRAWDGQQIPF